jgi:hypothetical protein
MSQYDLLHRLQLFRDRGQPPGNSGPLLDNHGSVRPGGRTSPLTEAETSRVRRALFGPVNHEENLRFVQQELARGQKEAERRWNYDFVNDRPVNDPDRRYVWESMESCPRKYTQIVSNSDTEESNNTVQPSSIEETSKNKQESVQSENIKPSAVHSIKSEKSQDTMSEKILSVKPNPIIMPPQPKTKSTHPFSLEMANSSISISAPATACATPHDSPQAGSAKSGSQIIPTSKSEAETRFCDKSKTTPAGCILSAAASSLSTSSKPSSKISTDQRSRSKSLHGTQKPISGLFRERKRSKSKTKIDTRSIKLQELQAPSQVSVVSGEVYEQL